MSTSKLMKVTYYDPKSQIRLLCYADTVVWDTKPTPTLTALRFGGYPERVQGLADAIYGGATIEIEDGKDTYSLKTLTRQYRRELSHDGVYAEATLIAEDDANPPNRMLATRMSRTRTRTTRTTIKSSRISRRAIPTFSAHRGNAGSCSTRWTKRPPFP